MDKAIKKVKKSINKKMDKLVKMDVPRDKALKKCASHKKMKGKINGKRKKDACCKDCQRGKS